MLLVLFIVPVHAEDLSAINPNVAQMKLFVDHGSFTYRAADDGYLISRVAWMVLPGESVDFILEYNDGTTSTGYIHTSTTFLVWKDCSLSLNGQTQTLSGAWLPGTYDYYYVCYAVSNATQSPSYYLVLVKDSVGFGGDQPNYANPNQPLKGDIIFKKALSASPSDNPIIQVTEETESLSGTTLVLATLDELFATQEMHENISGNFLSWIISIGGQVFGMLSFIWGLFYFLFIENFMLTFLCIEMGILAYRLNTARDVFMAFSLILSDNERLLRGLVRFIQLLVDLVWNIINVVNPMRWLRP